jgi:hypothetical protein
MQGKVRGGSVIHILWGPGWTRLPSRREKYCHNGGMAHHGAPFGGSDGLVCLSADYDCGLDGCQRVGAEATPRMFLTRMRRICVLIRGSREMATCPMPPISAG